jgi:hypothetical protein
MPYKTVGKTVYVKRGKKWRKKAKAKSAKSAKKMVRLLRAMVLKGNVNEN